jgi:hypothetical protein
MPYIGGGIEFQHTRLGILNPRVHPLLENFEVFRVGHGLNLAVWS